MKVIAASFVALLVLASEPTRAADPSPKPNVATPTLGGKQFWTDELLFRDWRIQRNVLTDNFRLLDENDVRHAWGSFADCRTKLNEMKREQKLEPMRGRVVILLHGLGRTRSSTRHMAKYLADEGHLTVLEFGYASTRAEVAEHAKSLAHVIENLAGVDEIDFVAHSLGNLVIRHYLGDEIERTEGHRPDPRIKRIVMLAPPNNGAKLAQLLGDNKLFKSIAGPPGAELGPRWAELEKHLATPTCEFGIIAGGRGEDHGHNPLLQADDDLIVAVTETKLAGAADFLVVPALHTFMMDEPKVEEATISFLLHGYFESADRRHPLGHDDAR
ncbi:MAG TPA: alpha/beta fold hydrolase [Pirellulales bacterium]|nr:alpha/beta fold hydrolase [Pirellulales bacterium]